VLRGDGVGLAKAEQHCSHNEKAYFAKQGNRRGRQVGRVLVSRYDEVVVDRLFDGKTQLTQALQPLIEAAETTLQLEAAKRVRTIVRVDAGGAAWTTSIGSWRVASKCMPKTTRVSVPACWRKMIPKCLDGKWAG
jgi:hypothetical protein